jgi:hypothetical protein
MGMEDKDFVKHDEHKIMLVLVDPHFVNGVGGVLTFGAEKYGPNEWQKCDDINRYKSSAYRHWNAYLSGEIYDPEVCWFIKK